MRSKELDKKEKFCPRKEAYVKAQLIERKIKHNTGITQNSIINFGKTLKYYFEEIGFPKTKKSHFIEQSFEFKNQGIFYTTK